MAKAEGSDRAKQDELNQLREEITVIQKKLQKQLKQRDESTHQLGVIEKQLHQARQQAARTQQAERELSDKLEQLQSQQLTTQQTIAEQRLALSNTLTQLYIESRALKSPLITSAKDETDFQRLQIYRRYLAEHQQTLLDDFESSLYKLEQQTNQAETAQQKLNSQVVEVNAALQTLKKQEQSRAQQLTKLELRISNDEQRVQQFKNDEATLASLIYSLQQARDQTKLGVDKPFRQLQGKLDWPVVGKTQHRFGERRVGDQLQWQGWVIAAPRGENVRAVATGQVMFADWLPGMGLLIVLDHGDRYFSLYGYNDSLLRTPGELVKAGDSIATVGDSGGQSNTALYFEIRHQAEPIDPKPWLRGVVAAY
ncbi:MAG: peptidoglycan DD-metalloendopeptidase family protein [Gammaproteobacteria bacterium]|nr:peptidoglycan DD-metalloendopeptidase family protein [Gammaproteobacteria bacterium]